MMVSFIRTELLKWGIIGHKTCETFLPHCIQNLKCAQNSILLLNISTLVYFFAYATIQSHRQGVQGGACAPHLSDWNLVAMQSGVFRTIFKIIGHPLPQHDESSLSTNILDLKPIRLYFAYHNFHLACTPPPFNECGYRPAIIKSYV